MGSHWLSSDLCFSTVAHTYTCILNNKCFLKNLYKFTETYLNFPLSGNPSMTWELALFQACWRASWVYDFLEGLWFKSPEFTLSSTILKSFLGKPSEQQKSSFTAMGTIRPFWHWGGKNNKFLYHGQQHILLAVLGVTPESQLWPR